jgi:hypothetical protein
MLCTTLNLKQQREKNETKALSDSNRSTRRGRDHLLDSFADNTKAAAFVLSNGGYEQSGKRQSLS